MLSSVYVRTINKYLFQFFRVQFIKHKRQYKKNQFTYYPIIGTYNTKLIFNLAMILLAVQYGITVLLVLERTKGTILYATNDKRLMEITQYLASTTKQFSFVKSWIHGLITNSIYVSSPYKLSRYSLIFATHIEQTRQLAQECLLYNIPLMGIITNLHSLNLVDYPLYSNKYNWTEVLFYYYIIFLCIEGEKLTQFLTFLKRSRMT